MHKRSSRHRRPRDVNELAVRIVDEVASDEPAEEIPLLEKNPHAAALGRLGGRKGGPARAAKLSAARRSEIARKAAEARWKRRQEDTAESSA